MSRISIDVEEAKNAATAATAAASDAEANLSTLTQNVSVLDTMEGAWRERGWDQLFEDYKKQADALLPTLEAMNEFLNGAAQAFQELSEGFAG